jgi:hypothetical protein
MAWDKGFDFRDTAAFVTDGANCTYVDLVVGGNSAYPVTRNGVTFGWNTQANINTRDRLNTNDPRLAGVQWGSGAPVLDFRVDLLAVGDYAIDLGLGDETGGSGVVNSKAYDNTTLLATLNAASATGHYVDATNIDRTSAANWVANHATVTKTFASTIFRITSETNTANISHVFLSQVSTEPRATVMKDDLFPKPFLRIPLTAGRLR